MASTHLDQQTLDRIAEDFSEAIRRGDQPSIDDYVARYPDESGQLRQLLTSIAMIEGIKRSSDHSRPKIAHHDLVIEQLDDYRIVREIGRGGMGVVLEAIDQSLHRRVAIKVLPSGLVSEPRNLDRFRRESKAAARLRHPNIVSVFGVGQSGDYHYYVMDYIDGINLRQWLQRVTGKSAEMIPTRDGNLAEASGAMSLQLGGNETDHDASLSMDGLSLPTQTDTQPYFHWVAELGTMITDALEYAHSQGTLHRDIKPANLLIDSQGSILITDFGLAKVAEHQPVTRTGDIVGTPQYMAPEAFDGQYDQRSETYAVGLTLFELLTLRPAISGSSHAEWIRNASSGITISPRQLNANIPRDLETVILKALAVEPERRYCSAAELRDDLRCFLADLPISARRSSLPQRVLRWSRREPMVASLTLAVFASLFALAMVSAAAYFRTRSALITAEQSRQSMVTASIERGKALDSAERQRQRAEANLTVALEAFDQIRENVWQRGLMPDAEILGEISDTGSTEVSASDAKILQSLLGFFDELAANNSNDLRAESAAAGRLAGDIYQRLGQLSEANRAYSDALDRYRSLADENAQDDQWVIEQVKLLNEQIVTSSLTGQIHRASGFFDQAIELLDQSPPTMSSPDGRFEYARAHALFASSIARAGVDNIPVRGLRAISRSMRYPGLSERSRKEMLAITAAIDTLTGLAEEFPDEAKYHVALARAYRDKSKVASRAGILGEASRSIKQSIDHLESLLSQDRQSAPIRYELAKTLSSAEALGPNQFRMLRLRRADTLSEELLRQSPALPRYQALRAHVLEVHAQNSHRRGDSSVAEKQLGTSLELYDSLIKSAPELLIYRVKKSQTLESFADLKLRAGDRTAALGYLQKALNESAPKGRAFNGSPITRNLSNRQRQKLDRIRNSEEKR